MWTEPYWNDHSVRLRLRHGSWSLSTLGSWARIPLNVPTIHRSWVYPRKKCESCCNARFLERVWYYSTWKHSPLKKDVNKAVTIPDFLQLGYESLRLLISDQYKVFCPTASSVLPPHWTQDVYILQGSTRDLWTECMFVSVSLFCAVLCT
jgi:hypothetical protein